MEIFKYILIIVLGGVLVWQLTLLVKDIIKKIKEKKRKECN